MKCPTICEDCEKVFRGGTNAFLRPACRRKRLSDSAKKRNLSKLGSDARSARRGETK